MDELPERAVVVGAGYIALEFAGILNGYGVDTHVMFRGDKPLRGCAAFINILLVNFGGLFYKLILIKNKYVFSLTQLMSKKLISISKCSVLCCHLPPA